METMDGLAGLLLTTLLWLTEIRNVVAQCADGWTEGTKACYKHFFTDPKTWHEANSGCVKAVRGGMLATVDNQRDTDIVTDLIRRNTTTDGPSTWIGLNSGGKNLGNFVKVDPN